MKAVADPPSGSARRALPLPPPRPAGRTNAPPLPSRTTTRAGGFAFAAQTPVEPAPIEPVQKPSKAHVVAPELERDEDLAIPRTASGESAVIARPIHPTRDSLENLQPPAPTPDDAPTVATPPIEPGPNPFDEDVWRAEGGSDSSADVDIAGAHAPIATHPLRESIVAFASNKRNLAIAAGGVVAVILLVMLLGGGGSKPSAQRAESERTAKTPAATRTAHKTASETTSETASETPPTETPPAPAVAEAAATETPSETPETEPPPSETPEAETPPSDTEAREDSGRTTQRASDTKPRKTGGTLAGKQVVLEYDTQAREAKAVPNAPKDDQAAISRARTSYAAGNTRLFSGDTDGAIRNYKQALAYYPAYVGAYRGLGLAYAQKGDKAAATRALKTYLGAAPTAKDAPIIRKRLQALK